ncbi:NADPH-dependent FMN reductase [Paenibacillus sp. UNC496MF]|uniref:NADPH-dependent FMN reductase n=1 Tax=Paenibacillus sp. UNC496MF TaxID=1502753 RepID=UPI000B831964|nr:NADPH-dependent FMN reductase [Paenibacillus sp. UNC496MF]
MRIAVLSGTVVGANTRTAMNRVLQEVRALRPEAEVALIDLAEHDLVYSDGRPYRHYKGDTRRVLEALMEADAVLIGTPTFQASIPAPLKNVFDLLPADGFRDKTVGIAVTAGTPKHFLMAEQQLKPILAYMKANVVPAYVFIEEKDFDGGTLANEDVGRRIRRLAEDTLALADAWGSIRRTS